MTRSGCASVNLWDVRLCMFVCCVTPVRLASIVCVCVCVCVWVGGWVGVTP